MKTERKESQNLVGVYVDLLNDQGFKHVFARDVNKDILIAFLNEVITDRHIIDLEHIRNEQVPSDPAIKASVFDIYCKTADGSMIVVELQRDTQGDYIDRSIYYSAFPIQTQIEKGNGKYTLSAVYIINILDFKLKELKHQSKVLSTFRLKELETNCILSKKYTLIFIELPKFTKKLGEFTPDNILEGFFYCLRHMAKLNKRPLELQQQIWARLFEAAQVAAMNKHERQLYISTMTTERDIRNQIAYAEERGLEQGIAQGIEQGTAASKIAIAKSLKAGGMDNHLIAKHTGLEIADIEQL